MPEYIAIEPYSVLVEVVAAIRRRTDDMALAKRVKDDFLNIDTLNFVEIGDVLAEGAAEIAAKIGVRGMDALIIQTAKEYNASLVSFDDEMAERAKEVVKIFFC
jgi:predicted nucleic acid-binding protein